MYDEDIHKQQVKAELARRGLGSYMNTTKWREFLIEINKLPFPPPYQRKDVLHPEPEPNNFDADVWYLGDWEEGIHPFFSIEWIRIRPRYLKHVGQLLPKVSVDCGTELERALQIIKQPYEKFEDSIWVYGYR
ncbi:hypothetical protein GCM10011396_25570 [Undibacterium terreum]|uniref:Uncharacterized protein n=2 Tax=Undibacterium terreum TaxID=1224302 RepID=A0A916XK54_9BURK|nr:hypothetical protein GCM10011396_25570 [Undibacterium terreum]